MCKISAILPAYNVEKYLGQCIESILSQNVSCEIIVINDGSTDNTLQVATDYSTKFDNIYVFSQENRGQSTARNLGIKKAKGEYLLLLDSDDYLIENTLKNLYELCVKNNLDYVKTAWKTFNDTTNKEFDNLPKIVDMNKVVTSKDFFIQSVFGGYNCVIWNGLIKREFLTKIGINYLEGVQYEDNTFALQLYTKDLFARTMQTDVFFLKVRLHEGTTTSAKPKLKKITDILTNVKVMNEYLQILDEQIQPYAQKTVSSLVFAMTAVYFRLDKKSQKQANKIIPKRVLKQAIKNPYDNFQKKKLIAFTYFRPILRLYNATVRALVLKIRNKGKSNG